MAEQEDGGGEGGESNGVRTHRTRDDGDVTQRK